MQKLLKENFSHLHASLQIIWGDLIISLHRGNSPRDPEYQEALVRHEAAFVGRIDVGGGIVVHCMGGIGRTVCNCNQK